MKFYLIDDDASVCSILKIMISQKGLGTVCGTASNGVDALEDIKYNAPDVVVVDLLMPLMDGITFVKKAKVLFPDICFVMLSQVSSKEMIAQAYETGVTFFIQKPVNGVEVVRVLTNVIEAIQMKRTFNQMQSILIKDTQATRDISQSKKQEENSTALPVSQPEERQSTKKLRNILQKLGVTGESGSGDIITLVNFLIDQGASSGKFAVNQLCAKFSPGNAKSMEQRVRRTVAVGLTNLANMGIEDYSNDTFQELAGTLYGYEQVRKEMNCIRGKSEEHGKVSLKNFLNSLQFSCTN